MALDVRVIRPDEFEIFRRVDQLAFQFAPEKGEDRPDSWARGELDRAFGAFGGGEMVGIGRNYSFDVTVPGGRRVPAAAVSWIGVLPTHRRRGVLTAIMAALADDARRHGEAVSILTASEATIYSRFGYGSAIDRVGFTIESGHGAFVAGWRDGGRVRLVEPAEAERLFPLVYEATRGVVGSVARPDFWWPEVLFGFPGEAKFHVVHETDGVVDGHALYSVVGDWAGGIPDRTVDVIDLQAADDHARLALWRYLLDIDLTVRVKSHQVPLHDPVRWTLADPRRRRVDFVNDGLWVKIVDAVAALEARTYDHDDDLVLAVDGAGYRVTVRDGAARCTRSDDPADVTMTGAALGAVWLGQRHLGELPGVHATDPSTLRRAERLFATHERAAMLSYF